MKSSINYKDTLFERGNLTPIRGKPTFKILHNIRNEINANTKAAYSNIRGGVHVHLGVVLTDVQYKLISPTPFVYLTHMGLLTIPDGTTAHANSNIQILHNEQIRMFR